MTGATSGFINAATALFSNAAGSGSVTSVTFTGDGTIYSSTPTAAVTTSGTLTPTLVNTPTGSGAVVLSAGGTLVNPVVGTQAVADNSTLAASTAYVTTAVANAIAGVNPAVAVQAATNAILPNSPIYANGAAGIGATITTLSLVALVVDGYTPVLNDRILVKNEASGGGLGAADNGVYKLTTLGVAGLTAWILTRALDYDQPSDINNTGTIPVVSGTANTNTSWLLTTAITTVGTDPLTYAQFSYAPNVGASGTFANRPGSPVTAQTYFATDITTDGTNTHGGKIIWDGGKWKPESGVMAIVVDYAAHSGAGNASETNYANYKIL